MKESKRPTAGGLYRDRNLLVIREGARFPERCAICNRPSEGEEDCDVESVEFTFAREKARHVEVKAVMAVARAAADVARGARYTGPVRAEIPLCSWHRGRRLRRLGVGVALTVLAVGTLLIERARGVVIVPPGELGFLDISLLNFVVIGAAFAGIVLTLTCVFDTSKLWFRADKYYDRLVWVRGAGREFLADLPQIEPDDYLRQARNYDPPAEGRHLTAEELIRRAGLDDE